MLIWTIGASAKGAVLLEHLLEAIAIPDEDEVEDVLTCEDDPMLLRVMVIRNYWNYFRRQIYSYCGPFLEVIPPATLTELGADSDTYNNTKGHWVVRLLHQSCRDFLNSRNSAGPLHVAVGNAEGNVDKLAVRYLQIVLPTSSTIYAPIVSTAVPGNINEIIDVVRYVEHHSLLEFVFAIVSKCEHLPLDACISSFLEQATSRDMPSPLAGYLFNPGYLYDSTDSHAACTTNYIVAACLMGLETTVRVLLALLTLRDDIWLRFGALILRQLLSVAMELNLDSLIPSILGLYVPGLKTPSLVSILPIVEEAARTGHTETIRSLFGRLFGGFDYVSNVELLERERHAWLRDAREARALRSKEGLKSTFGINLTSGRG
jgi:hypothetical protein